MLKYAMIALVGALSAVGAAGAVVSLDGAGHAQHPAFAGEAVASVPASVAKAADGHYWAQALVNGKSVRFLVDTGATVVALTSEDAARLGLDPRTLDYGTSVITAEGRARAAAVRLGSVSVAGARLDDVDALVIEKGLETSLLGMSYLGRLSRFEATKTALILRP